MRTLVGVDVGASHTEAAIACDPGRPLFRIRRPGISIRSGHAAEAVQRISRIVDTLTQEGGTAASIDSIVVGAAGTHTAQLRSDMEQLLRSVYSETLVHVTTDGEIALESAFGDHPGIVVCAGSGSIAYARFPDYSVRRVGGLGPILADEGSGFAIGREGLRAVARASDGRIPDTTLTTAIMAAVEVAALDDLVEWAWNADRPNIAALARVVCEQASSGDEVSQTIIDESAHDLGQLVQSLARGFGEGSDVDVAFSGGILSLDSPVRTALRAYLNERLPMLKISDRQVDPVLGAILKAHRRLSQQI